MTQDIKIKQAVIIAEGRGYNISESRMEFFSCLKRIFHTKKFSKRNFNMKRFMVGRGSVLLRVRVVDII